MITMSLQWAVAIYLTGFVTGMVTFVVAMWRADDANDAPLTQEELHEIESVDRGDHVACRMRFT